MGRLDALLGTRLPYSHRPLPRGSVLARARARAADPALWRGLLYLVLLLPIGLVELVVVLVLAFSAVLVSYPLWLGTLPEGQGIVWTGVFLAETASEALLVTLVGLVVMAAAAAFVPQVCRAHAALGRALLGPSKRVELGERVEVLTEGRFKAVEAAIVERRRIERDLHDGAQQRLVSLAMALGMARQKLENGRGLLRAVEEQASDVAVVDVRMPPGLRDEGLKAALEARRRTPGLAVLVLSQYVEERYGRELLESGMEGTGYLLKDRVADVAEFVSALETVGSGGTVLDPEVVGQLLARRRHNEGLASLTPREGEVLALVAEGRTNQAIAKALFVTHGAVEKHVKSIFGELGLPQGEADHRRVLAVLAYLRG